MRTGFALTGKNGNWWDQNSSMWTTHINSSSTGCAFCVYGNFNVMLQIEIVITTYSTQIMDNKITNKYILLGFIVLILFVILTA